MDPDQLALCGISSRSSLFAKVPVTGIQNEKVKRAECVFYLIKFVENLDVHYIRRSQVLQNAPVGAFCNIFDLD